uniref:Uncharacterized protein n=1 Tax=Arundo donax TaxID=35708 RepID=A0A0A8YKG1_ARUDO
MLLCRVGGLGLSQDSSALFGSGLYGKCLGLLAWIQTVDFTSSARTSVFVVKPEWGMIAARSCCS